MFHQGWPLSADVWGDKMLFFLSKGYRVIAHDPRGHGRFDQTRREMRWIPMPRMSRRWGGSSICKAPTMPATRRCRERLGFDGQEAYRPTDPIGAAEMPGPHHQKEADR